MSKIGKTKIARFRTDGSGENPVVVLVNSLAATMGMWDPQLPLLVERFRVIRYEHRGDGGAPADLSPFDIHDLAADLLGLLDALEVDRAHLCGLSVGGMIALGAAAEAPGRIRSLVLASTSARLGAPAFWFERAASVQRSGSSAIADTVVSRWFTRDFAIKHPDRVAWARAMVTSTDGDTYARYALMLARLDLQPVLTRIRAPTSVLAGIDDDAIPPSHGEKLANAIPTATLSVIPFAAHLLNVEQAAVFTAALIDQMAAADPGR